MKISVIIPYKNADAHIQRCIDSCQTAPGNFEFIFVNDNKGETADAEAVRKAMTQDERIIGIPNHQAQGVSGARNSGLDLADGDWIAFLDADDELLPDAYNTMTTAIERCQGHPIVQLNHLRYYATIDKLTCKYANSQGLYTLQDMPKEPQCWCMVWNKLINQRWLEANRIRFEEGLQYGEDELFVADLMRKHPAIIHATRSAVAIKRNFDNPESLSHSKGKDALWAQIDALERKIIATGEDETEIRRFLCDLLADHWGNPTFKKGIAGVENG